MRFILKCFILFFLFFNKIYATENSSIQSLEKSFDGKIGVFAINTMNHAVFQYRVNTFFPIQSTFKVFVVAAILKQSEKNPQILKQKIIYQKKDLVAWSPITERYLSKGMTIFDLCAVAMEYSDNTATNLLIKQLGGLQAIITFARSLHDNIFQLDHFEPHLNSNPKKFEDVSTPFLMGKNLQHILLGHVLANKQRQQLITWMRNNTTGDKQIRSGVPKNWIVADKTGSGQYGITNDIAVIWPSTQLPIVLAVYIVQNKKMAEKHEELIALVTRIVISSFKKGEMYG